MGGWPFPPTSPLGAKRFSQRPSNGLRFNPHRSRSGSVQRILSVVPAERILSICGDFSQRAPPIECSSISVAIFVAPRAPTAVPTSDKDLASSGRKVTANPDRDPPLLHLPPVDALVLVETAILGGDHRVLQFGRKSRERDSLLTLCIRPAGPPRLDAPLRFHHGHQRRHAADAIARNAAAVRRKTERNSRSRRLRPFATFRWYNLAPV
jgi:hypothetical protein